MFNNGYNLHTQRNQMNPYLVKEIMEASPAQLIMKIYDFAVVNCQKHNIEKTNRALQELINALRFDDPNAREIAIGLLKLYQFCQEEMRNRNYDIVQKILIDLRETWLGVINQQ